MQRVRMVPWPYAAGGGVVIIAVIVIGVRHFMAATSSTQSQPSGTPTVTLESVSALSAEAGPLSVVGTVKSESQATILAQTSGEIVSLSASIGDHVVAGQVLGQFENSAQRAAVTQAQGAYDAAQASLSKLTSTTAANTGITSQQAATAAQNAGTALDAALVSAYSSLDDAVHTKADVLFTNPHSGDPRFISLTVPNTQLVTNINNERLGLNNTFADMQGIVTASSSIDVAGSAQEMLSDTRQIAAFLNDLITALNQAVPNTNYSASAISGYQASLSVARTEVVAAISAIVAAQSAYDSALSSAQTASNSATSGTPQDIAAAQASLKSAQGALQAAQSALEKTIIRSPISGTIVSLPVTQGDFVPAFSQVAIVSNPGALYVDAQVTSDDAKTLAVGAPAMMESLVPGVITFVAPALDPSTGKIEVKVGVTGATGDLTDGEAVALSLTRARAPLSKQNAQLSIPINALKITPGGSVVFIVSASSTLAAQPVQLGPILGDRVVVSGISPDLQIVTDARGHSAGEFVIVGSDNATSTAP